MAVDTFISALDQCISESTGMPEFNFSAEIAVGTYRYNAMNVVSVTKRQMYLQDMFETAMISLTMQPSEYTELVLYGHEDMAIKLSQTPYTGGETITRTYRAVLTKHQDAQLEGNVANIGEAGLQDQMSISVVTFQLLSEAAFNLRLREVGGIFQSVTAASVLKHLLATTRLVDKFSESDSVATVTVDANVSTRVFNSIKLPEGLPFLAMADYLQDKYGLFSQGMGCFLKDRSWYVFAPFGLAKQTTDVFRLVVFNAPSGKYRSLDRNLKIVGKTMTVVATGFTNQAKNSDKEAMDGGTGVRYGHLRAIDSGTSSSDETVDPTRTPANYMTEYRSSTYNNPYQKTATSKHRFSDNPLKESSNLARRGGDIVTVVWEQGTMDLLVPGMPVTFHYGKNGKIQTKKGTLIGAEMTSNIPLGGLIEPKHHTTVKLTMFLKEA